MPRKLVCVFGSEFYSEHAVLLRKQMVYDPKRQLHHFEKAEAIVPVQSTSKSTGIMGMLPRKSSGGNKALALPPYAKAVSGAYEFLTKWYQPGDEIILVAVTGKHEEWVVLRAATKTLAEHLGAGTEPVRVESSPDPAVERDRDIFGDRPRDEPPNFLLGSKIESTVAITYNADRSLFDMSETNNLLLEEFPLTVTHLFSFNWATGKETYCDTYRDSMGQITSREVCYFKEMSWHFPALANSTMRFIHYEPEHTRAWNSIRATYYKTLASLPAPLLPSLPCSPSDTPIQPLPTRSKSWFPRPFNKKSKLASRRSTAPTVRPSGRSETLMSGFTTNPSFSPFTPTSTTPFSSPSSPRSGSLSFSDMTHSSRTSIDSGYCPTLEEAYTQLPGMTRHEVWTYPAFETHKSDYHLPKRVVWRSSKSE
ncbi:polysaccharide lyase family 8 protein [Rhizoctonia solani]|uniref:Polysaccharide lyase family 8 protein n=1 Tax=Rhizoctonia solani TaxID=456999 RepID=A0A8H8P4K6_9AGAM|nr:polysaccharide lyase family 8 protein [Rhizoctonia solani]QRW23723.1 polysaccharide lyase family 8 protein [Rhizoctonia solani]